MPGDRLRAALPDARRVERAGPGHGLHRRRAHCLLALSRQIVEDHGGIVPTEPEELQRLTGIGQYAARATAVHFSMSRATPFRAKRSVEKKYW